MRLAVMAVLALAGSAFGQKVELNIKVDQQSPARKSIPVYVGPPPIYVGAPIVYAPPVYVAPAFEVFSAPVYGLPYGARLAPGVYATPSGKPVAPGWFSIPGDGFPFDGPFRRGVRAASGYDR